MDNAKIEFTDDSYSLSLQLIAEAVRSIWRGPCIVRNYTDHGVEHSIRVISLAQRVLAAYDGPILSEPERFVLLAACWLHDVGMQCDVVRFPEILELARQTYGANPEGVFTASTADVYSEEEQLRLRADHHLLSAAWIHYARTNNSTVLATAIKTIPDDLVREVIDVCRYHAKLPIRECPESFTHLASGRKQLIAAVLRLADELDIDRSRVDLETVKNFSIGDHNAAFWWLHSRTAISYAGRTAIVMKIRLHPDDFRTYGEQISKLFITEFQTKNMPVLEILRRHGLQWVISSESCVVSDDLVEKLPDQIVRVLVNTSKNTNPRDDLADELLVWLRALGYELAERRPTLGQDVEMTVVISRGPLRQRVRITCIAGEVSASDVDSLSMKLDIKTNQGWLVTDSRVTPTAKARAIELENIKVFTLSDFLRELVWGPYFSYLEKQAETDKILDLYVDLTCCKTEVSDDGHAISEHFNSLDDYIDNWLIERGKAHMSILGDFGSGKTWFCRHYAYRQLQRYLKDPVRERLPVLITLRAFTKATNSQNLINDALIEQYKLPFVGSAYHAFQEMNRRGKLLLILDGFDEMARHVDYQTVVDNFWELSDLVTDQSKVILTSRREYFRWAKESKKILGGEEFGRRTIQLQPPRFEVIYLEPFSDAQISEVISRRKGDVIGTEIACRILRKSSLAEMARKPVLIELLLAALDEVSGDILDKTAQVYLYATNRLLLRNIDTQRTFTNTTDKLHFLCELAWEMIRTGELRIHYSSIPSKIAEYFGDRVKDQHQLDNWDFDLRNQTLLHNNAAGYYEFAHKSLAEYFVALKFSAELGILSPLVCNTYTEVDHRPCVMPYVRKNLEELKGTFGTMSLASPNMWAVRELMADMAESSAMQDLLDLVTSTKGKRLAEVQYVGGNAMTLLRLCGADLTNRRLSGTVLNGTDFSNADLTGTDFSGASLVGARFDNCRLDKADLRNSDLTGISMGEMRDFYDVAWSPDERLISCLSTSRFPEGQLTVVDPGNFKILKSIPFDHEVVSMCWSANGEQIAVLSMDQVTVINLGERSIVRQPISTIGRLLRTYSSAGFQFIRGTIHSSQPKVDPDEQATVRIVIESLRRRRTTEKFLLDEFDSIIRCLNSPKVTPIEIGGQSYYVDYGVRVISYSDHIPSVLASLDNPPQPIRSASVSPSGRRLLLGHGDFVSIWDIEVGSKASGQCLQTLSLQTSCRDTQVGGAVGIREPGSWTQEVTLVEFLADTGAVLDKKQKRALESIREKRRREGDSPTKIVGLR